MLQLQGEDGTKHWLDLQRGKSLLVSAFLSRNLYNKLMSYTPLAEQDLPQARAQGSTILVCAISPWQPGYMSITSSVSELIAVRLLGNLKAYLKTE